MHRQSWTIGQLAAETGLTVRALRHFEDKGLLGTVSRTGAGQRNYGRGEVERLYQVIALRALGLPLARIAVVLESPPALAQALANQLTHVDEQLASLGSLRSLLQRAINRGSQPISVEELIKVVRHTAVSQELVNKYLDEADRAILADRAAQLGDEATRIVQADYPRLYHLAQEQFGLGTPPDAAAMQAIAGQLEELSEELTGGAAGPSHKVQQMWRERSEQITGSDWGNLADYVMVARKHYRSVAGSSDAATAAT